MLSIIIPSYNYPVYNLVKHLYSQCHALAIPFEIIVRDDSSRHQYNNFAINQLPNCKYLISEKNYGLSITRNKLIQTAQYDWILLLDNDVLPQNDAFIKNYISHINSTTDVLFGGISYEKKAPVKEEKLRWVYGMSREAQSAQYRKESKLFLCSNTLFSKKVFTELMFDESIVNYGYEDLVFAKQLEKKGLKVLHIDNAVLHLKLDTSSQFLQKTQVALNTLNSLITNKTLSHTDTGITKMHHFLKTKQLLPFVRLSNKVLGLEKLITRNLLSNRPYLKLFDFYRVLYFDHLQKK